MISSLASLLPAPWLAAAEGQPVLLPYYHMVTNEPAPHVRPLYRFRSVREFTADVEFFLRHFRPVGVDEILKPAAAKDGKRPFLLTFDDGFREMHDIVAPILKGRGVPAVFFITTSTLDNVAACFHQTLALVLDARERLGPRFPEAKVKHLIAAAGLASHDLGAALKSIPWAKRDVAARIAEVCEVDVAAFLRDRKPYLTTEQIRAMQAQGFSFGAHSVDHPLYGDLPLDEQLRQTRDSMAVMVETFGIRPRAFAFPHTDTGVSATFFDTVFGEGTVEVSFGTSGPAFDAEARNFQRFSMEKTAARAVEILARQAMRGVKRRAQGASRIERAPDATASSPAEAASAFAA